MTKIQRNIKSYKEVNKMKRTTIILSLIFALAIALSVSIPTLAANPVNTIITGTVTGKIDLSAPSTFSLGTNMQPSVTPYTANSGATGMVYCNKGWSVTANHATGTMFDGGSSYLVDQIKVQLTGGNTGGTLQDATVGSTTSDTVKTGTAGDHNKGVALTLAASQLVNYVDAPGAYTITIVLTGSMP